MGKFIPMKSLKEYELRLSRLSGESGNEIAGKAIYSGADILADKIRENIKSLPTISDKENMAAYKSGKKSRLTVKQKAGLLAALGVSKIREDNGFLNVKIGFDGYNDIKTKKYPKGQPNKLIARVAESGSSYMDKSPFVRPAVNAVKKSVEAEMQKIVDEEIKKIME